MAPAHGTARRTMRPAAGNLNRHNPVDSAAALPLRMGAGREYSRFQQGVIKRYYRNLDTITLQRLSEIVSELYIETAAGGGKKADRLWQRAADTLQKTDASDARIAKILEQRNLEQLARLVGELSG